MLGIFFGIFFSCGLLSNSSIIINLCFLMPFAFCVLSKSFYYTEDLGFMFTQSNSVLSFLTFCLVFLVLLATYRVGEDMYLITVMLLGVILYSCFQVNNLLSFYILFEVSLLPMVYMIIGWGYQPERVQAGVYMVMYTVFCSMPLLFMIFVFYSRCSSLHLHTLQMINIIPPVFLGLASFLAFFVKLPLYGLHIWLPKAHVEAPLGGSMLLAGLLLKLGGYGLYLYYSLVNISLHGSFVMFILAVAMWGGVMCAVVCLTQSDIKALVAYSSVVHMCLVILGFLSGTSWGFSCANITMIAHGWVSSGMFLVSYITYSLTGSRSFYYTKGLLQLFPLLSLLWFTICIFNMAVPPTVNLLGELAAVPVSAMYSLWLLIILLFLMFLSVCYNMYLYSSLAHGAISNYSIVGKTMNNPMLLATFGHLFPVILFVLGGDLLT